MPGKADGWDFIMGQSFTNVPRVSAPSVLMTTVFGMRNTFVEQPNTQLLQALDLQARRRRPRTSQTMACWLWDARDIACTSAEPAIVEDDSQLRILIYGKATSRPCYE